MVCSWRDRSDTDLVTSVVFSTGTVSAVVVSVGVFTGGGFSFKTSSLGRAPAKGSDFFLVRLGLEEVGVVFSSEDFEGD